MLHPARRNIQRNIADALGQAADSISKPIALTIFITNRRIPLRLASPSGPSGCNRSIRIVKAAAACVARLESRVAHLEELVEQWQASGCSFFQSRAQLRSQAAGPLRPRSIRCWKPRCRREKPGHLAGTTTSTRKSESPGFCFPIFFFHSSRNPPLAVSPQRFCFPRT
jgi:hypothetical protein